MATAFTEARLSNQLILYGNGIIEEHCEWAGLSK